MIKCFVPDPAKFDRGQQVDALEVTGGSYGLVCFRPEGGSGYTDQQVYERAGLGYPAGRLRAMWDTPPFSVRVLRKMREPDAEEARFGADFLWVLLASKADG